MEKVVRLDDYRRSPAPQPRHAASPSAPRYYCQRCDADRFRLFAGGSVHCADCGALIRNVAVSEPPPSRGAGR